jgi:hypothetical protein
MAFSDEIIQKVWEKGKVVPSYDASKYRKDVCDAWIVRSDYGDRNSKYGWEIDHILPVSKGGKDDLSNLRPLQWENNASKQDNKLVCVVTSSGNSNVNKS